ncbi:phage tail sheath family protein [Paraflavitalea speifideaquila]|uniref:phage tail sheath family protein n=1 Tax=Paraflavitalea speifideaquila TaxID=3076558 RepID=UPI0028E2A1E0|nr:phage tail sheath C-terminal domain-containing protein [Paraflavitalea speifideiaquila]
MSQINETAIRTPGVYTTEIPTLPSSVAQVSTAIPAFIGYTQKSVNEIGDSLLNIPTKIFSLKDYEQFFGFPEKEMGITVTITKTMDTSVLPAKLISQIAQASITDVSKHNMHHCLRLYFENGGGPCYIVSVGATTVPTSPPSLSPPAAPTPTLIDASELQAGLDALKAYDEPTLIVFPEGQGITGEGDYYSLIGQAIEQCRILQDRFTLMDIHHSLPVPPSIPPPTPVVPNTTSTIAHFRSAFGKTDYLNYAAAYYPNLKTTFDFTFNDYDVDVVVVTNSVSALPVSLDTLKNSDNAVYNLCLDAIRSQLSPTLSPAPAMAGIYAKIDASRGVWKAPANVSVNSIYDVTDFITDEEQDDMNIDPGSGKSVNAIRPFTGKGILVWGARTLEGNSSEWKFISVRRFFIMVEESAKKATFPFVFEPNDANTWVKVRAMLENYLTLLWRQGALAGAKPENAFFVKCGLGQTMTSQDILDGRLIVEIGMAAVRPAEFIILRFMHKLQDS